MRRVPESGSTARGPSVPAPVTRGAGVATVVAVAGGAVAAFGTTAVGSSGAGPADPPASATSSNLANSSNLALAAEAPGGSAQAQASVPGPVGGAMARLAVPLPDQAKDRLTEPAVMDPAQLSGAVQRAQGEARRLAEQARARADERRAAAARAGAAVQAGDDEEADDAEERRTAERARRAGRAADAGSAANCGLDTGGLGPVRSHVRTAANVLGCAFGRPEVLGVAGRGGPSDHPEGLALDFMVDRVTGDALADCALRHREELGVSYVIWRQRIDTGSGFRPMPDRGSPTANHFDHVHVSFRSGAGNGAPFSC